MANEPERPIEKLLRAAAKKRRDEAGAPFELHPATRRLLQGEVARQFAKPQREAASLSSLLARLWPRLAWGAAIVAVLGAVVWLVLPGTRDEKTAALLAKNQPVLQTAPINESLPPAASAPVAVAPPPAKTPLAQPATVAYADRSQVQSRSAAARPGNGEKELAKDNLAAAAAGEPVDKLLPAAGRQGADRKKTVEAETTPPSVTVVQAPAGAISGASGGRYGFAGASAPPGNAPTAPSTPPPVTATPASATSVAVDESMKLKDGEPGRQALAFKPQTEAGSANRVSATPVATGGLAGTYAASLKAEKQLGISQRFAQVTAGQKAKSAISGKATAAHPVLASFHVEQSGSELRIVDGDGSVYSGYVQLADTTRRAGAIRPDASAAAEAARAPKDALEEKPATRLESDQLLPQTYFFRVTGTNKSLHKKVVFTGNLLPAAHAKQPAPVSTNLSIASRVNGFQGGSPRLLDVPLLNTRILGKVVVGNAKAVEINAEPANP
jgi:hypothetical protein